MSTAIDIIEKSIKEANNFCNTYDVSLVGSFTEFRKIVLEHCIKINTEIAFQEKTKMRNYKRFMIEGIRDNSAYRVSVKILWWWESAYVKTDFFDISYSSFEEAKEAVEKYKNRLTIIEGK